MDAQTMTYASFGWLTHSESYNGQAVYFATGDSVDGRLYTNDILNIWGGPIFHGRVDSVASFVNYAHGGAPEDYPDFQNGLYLSSPQIDMAVLMSNGHITSVRNRAQEVQGIWLGPNGGRPYLIIFSPAGTVTIMRMDASGEWSPVIVEKYLSTTNGAIYVEETVQVKGTLNGEVTIATPKNKDIEIVDDMVYAYPANPEEVWSGSFDVTVPEFNDKLGLLSGGDVVLKKTWEHDDQGNEWSDMYVMGSIAAIVGSFRNEYYTYKPQKTLHMYGSLAQYTRGPVGMTGGRGFSKDYLFDTRFSTEPPPYFTTLTYDFSGWTLYP